MTNFLVIFSADGKELTRQSCNDVIGTVGDPSESTCPIYGSEISLGEKGDGKRDILVTPDEEDTPWTTPYRYRLSNSRYLLPKPVLKTIAPSLVPTGSATLSGAQDGAVILSGSNFLPISDVILTRVAGTKGAVGMRAGQGELLSPKFLDARHLKINVFDGVPREPARWKLRVMNRAAESN